MKRLTLPLMLCAAPLAAQGPARYEGAPIRYESPARSGPVERLIERLKAKTTTLRYDDARGFLPALLEALKIPQSSQLLVFSKTSFQLERISPWTPRAIYFGDDAYVGWIPGAPLIEVTSLDPVKGPVFYTLAQSRGAARFEREAACLTCHASPRTQGWPGHLVRSVHPDSQGQPIYAAGTFVTTHESPVEQRWGGWYVTAASLKQRHLGNRTVGSGRKALESIRAAPLNDLSDVFDTTRYLTPHSDVIALLVFEHQTEMHNRIARARYEACLALARSESRVPRKQLLRIAKGLLEYLLFKNEARLRGPIAGSTTFARDFMARGKRDSRGRSLRDLDLRRRLFRYPCSWLIHSKAFAALPAPLLEVVYEELERILNGRSANDGYRRLSAPHRKAIREILLATMEDVPRSWRR